MRADMADRGILVVLPGLGGTGAMFAPLLAEIGDRIATQIIAYPTDEFLTYRELTEYVRARLPRDRPFVILAESFSGPIAITIAASPPADLRGLMLCCTFARFPNGVLRQAGRLLPFLPVTRPPMAVMGPILMGRWRTRALTDALSEALARVDPRVLRGRALQALSVDTAALFGRTNVPALLLSATDDRVVARAAIDDLLRANPRARHVQLPGPHFLLQCNPSEAVEQILGFVASLDAV